MNSGDDMKQVCSYLRMIERTRLLKNTTEELGQLVGFSIGNGNGLARMGGKSFFMKDAIFRELAHIVQMQTGLDLQHVLDTYVEADKIVGRLGKVKDPNDVCLHLIWHFYGDAEVTDDIANIVGNSDYLTTEGRHVPIIVLMLLKALPRLRDKGGDIKEIGQDYRRVFHLLKAAVCKNILIEKIPLLAEKEDEVRKNPEWCCRLHLIDMTNDILNWYGGISTHERIYLSSKESLENLFLPDIEGLWTEDPISTVFWKFEMVVNGYHVYHYSFDSKRKELRYTKYEMRFYLSEQDSLAIAIHPRYARYVVSGLPIPNNFFAHLDYIIEDDTISFQPRFSDGNWFRCKQLHRVEKEDYFTRLLNDDRIEKVDDFADDAFDFLISLEAITNEHIYIKKDEEKCYKVPKSLNPLLDEVTFNDSIGTFTFKKKCQGLPDIYIAFDDYGLYYDVSTEESMEELGIEVVDRI